MATYRYHCSACFKTYIGEQLGGPMTCNCTPAKQIVGKYYADSEVPLSSALKEEVSCTEAATRRNALCLRWGIDNKSHKQHGANFSGTQSMVNLIHDIVSPVQGLLRTAVRQHIINDYGYDIDTRKMT
ncbi:MAG: hypothetical protein RI907_4006 [Pseudomonadota bacterium]|jgi:hypothetical protein